MNESIDIHDAQDWQDITDIDNESAKQTECMGNDDPVNDGFAV